MGKLRYLQFSADGKCYICPEKDVLRVVTLKREELYTSPYHSDILSYITVFENEVIPVFELRQNVKNSEQKIFLTVIIKKLLSVIAVIIDEVVNFIEIDEAVLETAIDVPEKLSKKALDYNGVACYFFNIDAFLAGVDNEKFSDSR